MKRPEPVDPEGLSPLQAYEFAMLEYQMDAVQRVLALMAVPVEARSASWAAEYDDAREARQALREFEPFAWWDPLKVAGAAMEEHRRETRAAFEQACRDGAPAEVIWEAFLNDFAAWKYLRPHVDTSPESGEDE